MRCPDCMRETVYVTVPEREGLSGKEENRKPGTLRAANREGLCTTCLRVRKGYRPHGQVRFPGRNRLIKTSTMTDEECESVREKLTIMELDRRARGVPENGVPVEDWARGNGGLYSWQVK